jgi:rubrerythrin
MENFTSFFPPPDYSRTNEMPKLYKRLDEVLILVKNSIQGEREAELFYDYLISVAPSQEEKDIIATIRNDERKHNKYFREIYNYYTKQKITAPETTNFEKPKSYIDGITNAKFGELAAVEKYRDIRAGLPTQYYRDMVFEILTDELKHADKYDYILYLNPQNKTLSPSISEPLTPPQKKTFTLEEAKAIATLLGIDFSKEKFDLQQFRIGLDVELEHGRKDDPTNVTNDDPIATGKIALAHLTEFPDYYNRIIKLEEEAKAYWSGRSNI